LARSARHPRREAQITRLLLVWATLAAALFAACAKNEDPPGGPPDVAPPHVVRIVPESGAVVPSLDDDAVIRFDEVIDEMPQTLGRQVLLSPVSGGVRVQWHRNNITVRPREGWKRRVYRLELLPGIVDLRRNRLDTGTVVLFSTGPEIGHARIGGIALAWAEQRVLPNALIEAVPLPDSVGYLTLADSGGQFDLEGIAPGRYIVYAVQDENNDRRRGLREAYDSALVTVDSSTNVAMYTFVHDTVGPRLRGASAVDSLAVRLEFTQPLDPEKLLDTAQVHLRELPDSTPVPVAGIMSQRLYDSLTAAAAKARADSAARSDTAAARDTAARQPPGAGQPPEQPGRPPRARVDTALVRRLLALRPVPSDRVMLTAGRVLKPETRYVVEVIGATNLIGKQGDTTRVSFLTPKPPAPADTARRAPRTPP
jgi:hypothetical protein